MVLGIGTLFNGLLRVLGLRRRRTQSERGTQEPLIDGAITFPTVLHSFRPSEARRKFKILLSIDGGGIRGVIPACVLQKFEELIKEYISKTQNVSEDSFEIDLADYIDCVAGTSVGSILAMYVASKGGNSQNVFNKGDFREEGPIRPGGTKGIVAVFSRRGPRIFFRPWFLRRMLGLAFNLGKPKFSNKGVTETLADVFGEIKMSELAIPLVVPSFELSHSRPVDFWSNPGAAGEKRCGYSWVKVRSGTAEKGKQYLPYALHAEKGGLEWEPDKVPEYGHDYLAWQVCRASAAAPTFFPAAPVSCLTKDDRGMFIDGGMIANNPTINALSFMLTQGLVSDIREVAVVSIGTGSGLPDLTSKVDAGVFGWGSDLLSVLMDRQSESIQAIVDQAYYKIAQVELGQYVRIQITRDVGEEGHDILSVMDDAKNVPKLVQLGNELADQSVQALRQFVEKFIMAEK